MQILDRDSIVTRMIQTVRAKTSAITYFGPGPFRAFLFAVATELQHLYYRMFQVEQRLDLLSASGDALDAWGAGRGLARLGASASSVILSLSAPRTITATGTVTISGTVATGVGTAFQTVLATGDALLVGGVSYAVTGVTSDTVASVVAGANVSTPTAFQVSKASVTIPVSPTPLRVSSTAGSTFDFTENVTLVPEFVGAPTLVAKTIAVSEGTGSSQNVATGTINTVLNPSVVPLVTLTVTNPSIAQGGSDAESDPEYRSRIVSLFSGLNVGTRQFYDVQARLALPRVSRTYLARGGSLNEVVLYCATRDGSTLTTQEKQTLVTALTDYTPVQSFVTIKDMNYQDVAVSFSTTLLPGSSASAVATSLARSLSDYLNWTTWPFETAVQADNLVSIASNTPGVDDITLSTFTPLVDVALPPATLPRVGVIAVTDVTAGTTASVVSMTNQYPRIV